MSRLIDGDRAGPFDDTVRERGCADGVMDLDEPGEAVPVAPRLPRGVGVRLALAGGARACDADPRAIRPSGPVSGTAEAIGVLAGAAAAL